MIVRLIPETDAKRPINPQEKERKRYSMNYYYDSSGMIHYFNIQDILDDVMSRQSPVGGASGVGRRRRRRPRPPHGFQHPMFGHHTPIQYPAPVPVAQPIPAPVPVPASQPQQRGQGLDMRAALDALGALLPAAGQMIAAFRHPPERPRLTGQPDRDLPEILDYVAGNFEHARSGAQTAGVLATAGAVMEILASL